MSTNNQQHNTRFHSFHHFLSRLATSRSALALCGVALFSRLGVAAVLKRRVGGHAARCREAVDDDGGADEGVKKAGGARFGSELGKIVFFVCLEEVREEAVGDAVEVAVADVPETADDGGGLLEEVVENGVDARERKGERRRRRRREG